MGHRVTLAMPAFSLPVSVSPLLHTDFILAAWPHFMSVALTFQRHAVKVVEIVFQLFPKT